MILTSTRWQHFTAMVLIGDGVMAVVHPKKDARAWTAGPRSWRKLMRELHRRPGLTRLIGAAQIAAGIWWMLSTEDSD
jgi:uncharacterized protein YjeT (DUF2065 family)